MAAIYPRVSDEIRRNIHEYLGRGDAMAETTSSDTVLNYVSRKARGSAVCICAANRLRFNKFETALGEGVKTHTGLTVRQTNAEDLTFPHLFELIRRLIDVALEKSIAVLIFVEGFTLTKNDQVPKDIFDNPKFSMMAVGEDSEARQNLNVKMGGLVLAKTEGISKALAFVESHLKDADELDRKSVV